MKKEAPKHYKGANGLDTIALIRERDGIQASTNFCLDNVLKYATRLWRKESPVDDARKIVIYSNRAYDDLLEEIECLDDGIVEDDGVDLDLYRTTVWNDINYINNQLGIEEVISYLQGTLIAETKHISIEECGYNRVKNQLFLLTILAGSLLGYVKNIIKDNYVNEETKTPHVEENVGDIFNRRPYVVEVGNGNGAMTQITDGTIALASNIIKMVNDKMK